jgi:preprotein translocase subunit YajC
VLGIPGMMVVMVALFWFMIIRPQQQRETDHEKMLDELKVYDKVVTIGGILGTITDIRKNDDVVTLRIDEKTGSEIRVLKSHISRPEEKDADAKNEKESEKKSA